MSYKTSSRGVFSPVAFPERAFTRATIFVQGGTRTLFSKSFVCACHCSATALYSSNANSCNSKSRFFWIVLARIQTLLGQRPFESKSGCWEIFSVRGRLFSDKNSHGTYISSIHIFKNRKKWVLNYSVLLIHVIKWFRPKLRIAGWVLGSLFTKNWHSTDTQ